MSVKQVSDPRKVKRTLGKNPNSKTVRDGRCNASTVEGDASTVEPGILFFAKISTPSTVKMFPSTVKLDTATVEVTELNFTTFNTFLRLQIFLT